MSGDTTDFRQAVSDLAPILAAALSVSIVSAAGGVTNAPLALMGGFTSRALSAITESQAVCFTIQALASLPEPLLGPVGGPVFLEPAKATLPAAGSLLVEHARSNPQQCVALQRLGYQLGQSELLASLTASLREEQPTARVPPVVLERKAPDSGGASHSLLKSEVEQVVVPREEDRDATSSA